MEALRWILLGLGVLLILGIWLVGLRRSKGSADAAARAAAQASPAREGPPIGALEPSVVEESFDIAFGATEPDPPVRPREEPSLIVEVPRGDPPIVTLDDLPESVEDIELARPAPAPMREYVVSPEPIGEAAVELPVVRFDAPAPPARDVRPAAPARAEPPAPSAPPAPPVTPVKRRGWSFFGEDRSRPAPVAATPDPLDEALAAEATIPSLREPAAVEPVAAPPTPAPAPEPPSDPEPRRSPTPLQKILSIRMVLTRQQTVPGDQLAALLLGEGLKFGRYSIFHRELHGDRPIFSVASLVEPGYFDPNAMAGQRFPGVSFFAVLPGPLPAPQTFDDILSTARRLSERLGGVLQDDTGATLTGQRILALREELVHFEHLLSLARQARS